MAVDSLLLKIET